MTYTIQRRWGDAIRALRVEHGLSVSALARTVGLDPSHLWRAEQGQAGLGDELRIRLAEALGVRVESIFSYPDTSSEGTECPSAASAWDAAASRQSETPPPTPRSPRRRSRHRAPSAAAPERSAVSADPNGPEAAS